mmetsp:Transcript_85609/g.237272  ORF Transcript_85609/g.237272 Transcript_85609/m.237272 type:complete len:423 (+) Transcript_85609:56-1324(+)
MQVQLGMPLLVAALWLLWPFVRWTWPVLLESDHLAGCLLLIVFVWSASILLTKPLPVSLATERSASDTAAKDESPSSRKGPQREGPVSAHDAKAEDVALPAGPPHIQIIDMSTGAMTRSNPSAPCYWENERARGCFLCLARNTLATDADCGDADEYFRGKKRLWEVRLQISFKNNEHLSEMRFACAPFERPPIGAAQVAVHRALIRMVGSSLHGLYNSPGDDPRGRPADDVEPPLTSVPMCEVDQYIAPQSGEDPPHLLDPNFPKLGILKTRDPASHRKALRRVAFQAGDVHTFAFWGPSRAFDLMRWQVGHVPLFRGVNLDLLNGPPPIFMTLYVLREGSGREKRHLKSRMTTIWRVAGWSYLHPPTPERLERLQERVTGGAGAGDQCRHSARPAANTPRCGASFVPCGAGIAKFIHTHLR